MGTGDSVSVSSGTTCRHDPLLAMILAVHVVRLLRNADPSFHDLPDPSTYLIRVEVMELLHRICPLTNPTSPDTTFTVTILREEFPSLVLLLAGPG